MATVLARSLRERVVINENGRRRTVTKLEAGLKQLTNKAASGDLKALQLLTTLLRSAEENSNRASAPTPIEEVDQKILAGILKRIEAANRDQDESATNNS